MLAMTPPECPVGSGGVDRHECGASVHIDGYGGRPLGAGSHGEGHSE
jgi:hypothetical protein